MKALKITGIVLLSLLLIGVVGYNILKTQTKKNSPEVSKTVNMASAQFGIRYSSPFKKGRKIFGDLVPYGVVWRTGANEPTVFSCSKDIEIYGKKIPAGEYSLWTIPMEMEWEVLFNKEIPSWGVDFNQKAQHNPKTDVAIVRAAVKSSVKVYESFDISFEEKPQPAMVFTWDNVQATLPIIVLE